MNAEGHVPMYEVNGGIPLEGSVKIQGSKNAVLPIIAATLLVDGEVCLLGCPRIKDVMIMLGILQKLGGTWEWQGDCLRICTQNINNTKVDAYLSAQCRASVLYMGALLGRHKSVILPESGGCAIGKRPINIHLDGMERLGVRVSYEEEHIVMNGEQMVPITYHMAFPSVGATQNMILASVMLPGITKIYNGAREPEVCYLCDFLRKCGASIQGEGSACIYIHGGNGLSGCEFNIPGDRIVAGTYLAMGVVTGGNVEIKHIRTEELSRLLYEFKKMGCRIRTEEDKVYLYRDVNKPLRAIECIYTQPYPGFPTDMQSQWMVCQSIAQGKSKIVERIFENRFGIAEQLCKMGADIVIRDDTACITGVRKLQGTQVEGKDLRGTAALLVAGVAAEGVTTIYGDTYAERGHEDLVRDMCSLGVRIKKR